MMRVLMLHERFAPDSGGGGEYVALERARGLIAAGHQVTVICAGDPAMSEVEGVRTRRYRVPRPLTLLLLPIALAEARRSDIVHGFTYHAALLAWLSGRLSGRPVVCEQLGLFGPAWRGMRPGLGGRVYERMERLLLRLPFDRFLFLSGHSLALAQQLGFRGRAEVIAPGIDTAAEPAPKDDPPVVLFAGKFDTRKGIDRLCDVAARMPDTRFQAVGWWPGEREETLTVPPNLTFIEGRGAVYRAALARASVFFLPSRAETFGLVIYEAMQAGCSVVSTIGGDYAGQYLPDWDVDHAVAALRLRLTDPVLRQGESEENRRRAARFTWSRSSDDVLAVYRTLLPAPPGAESVS